MDNQFHLKVALLPAVVVTAGGTSSDNTQEKITSCVHIKKKANPIAVVDYGSIHLNMDGSLLDSIYNIGDGQSRWWWYEK